MSENRHEETDAARAQIAAATREILRTGRVGAVPDHIRRVLDEDEGGAPGRSQSARWLVAGAAAALAVGGVAWFLGLVPLF